MAPTPLGTGLRHEETGFQGLRVEETDRNWPAAVVPTSDVFSLFIFNSLPFSLKT